MRVLVGCEFSGVVRDAFLSRGHKAVSCDILPTESKGPHMIMDVAEAIMSADWDIIILHPPCTALAVSGNSTYGVGRIKYEKRIIAAGWTKNLFGIAKRKATVGVALENPVGVLPRMVDMPCTQYIQPWMFGHPEQKKTGLWLHGLPKLTPTNNVYDAMMRLDKSERERVFRLAPSKDRWKIRSRTYSGIALAMADQWGGIC